MLDLSFLMEDPDFCSQIILERSFIVDRQHGRPVIDTKQALIKGVVQPLTAEDIQALANSANGYPTEALVLFTVSPLTAGSGDVRADRVVFEGVAYDVVQVEDWQPNGNYCRSIIQRTHDVHDTNPRTCGVR